MIFLCYDKIDGKAKVVYIIGRKQRHVIRVVWKSAPCAIQMHLLKRRLVAFMGLNASQF